MIRRAYPDFGLWSLFLTGVACGVGFALGAERASGADAGIAAPIRSAERDAPETLEELRKIVEQDENSAIAGWALNSYLGRQSNAGLRRLTGDRSTTVGLAAMWNLLREDGELERWVRPQRFLGYFHGRTRVPPPASWSVEVTRIASTVVFPGNQDIAGPEAEQSLSPFSPAMRSWRRPALHATSMNGKLMARTGVDAEVAGSKTIIRWADREIRVDSKVIGEVMDRPELPDRLAVRPHEDCWLVLLYHARGWPSRLFCFDKNDGTVRWQTRIWARGIGGIFEGSGPPREHIAHLVPLGDRVGVFGVGHIVYAEGYDLATGKTLYRFSPLEWSWQRAFPPDLRYER